MKIYHKFLVLLTCFLFLLLSPGKNDLLAVPCSPSPSVKIVGDDTYTPIDSTSIQEAYDYASFDLGWSGFTLQLANEIFYEDLTLNGGAVILDGGYDCSFTTRLSPSSVLGTITIATGSLNFAAGTESIAVVSTDQCDFDIDLDGFTRIGSCAGSADDCNDNDPDTSPGAVEICDGLDNNCNGQVDEGLPPTDVDGDGYYDTGSCGPVTDDCNDNNPSIHPNALEIPYDGIDQDCYLGDLTFPDGNDCSDCHDSANEMYPVHSVSIATDETCVICHAATVSNLLSGHYGDKVRTADNNMIAGSTINCYSCHDANSSSHDGGALGNGSNIVWGQVVSAWQSQSFTCDSCHRSRASLHITTTAHNRRVIDSSCGQCHTSDTAMLGNPGNGNLANDADLDVLHRSDCALCHAYLGTAVDAGIARQAIQQGLNGTQITCTNCHTDKGTNHGAPVSGKHVEHLALSGIGCGTCHGSIPFFNSGTDANSDGQYDLSETDVCATCHQDGTGTAVSGVKAGWYDPIYLVGCNGCHATAPTTGNHGVHLTVASCGSCHDGSIPNTTAPEQHLDQDIDVYDFTPADLGYPADKAIGSAYDSCATSYCHSTAQGVVDPTDAPTFVASPAWGTSFGGTEATCTGCHDSGGHVGDAGSALTTGSHAKHLNFRYDQDATCNACHFDWSYTGCTSCHGREVKHADQQIDVEFKPNFPLSAVSSSGSYSGDPAPQTPYGSCAALYCHSPGTKASAPYDDPNITALTWGNANLPGDCTGCHNGDSASVLPMTTGSHGSHIGNYDCSKCHDRTVENSRSLNSTVYAAKNYSYGQRYHVDGWVTVAFSGDIATSGSYAGAASPTTYRAPGSAAGACANTYCHSDGSSVATAVIPDNTSPDWGTAGLSCDGCHSYPPAYDSGTPKANNHMSHAAYGCDACHSGTTTTGNTITDPGKHANQVFDIQAGSGVNFSYSFASGGGTCSNISCHGDSGAVWGAEANHDAIVTTVGTASCGNCHSDPPPLVNDQDPLGHESCATCHDVNGELKGLASGKSAPGDCTTCHGMAIGNIHSDMSAAHIATPGSDWVLVFAGGSHDSAMIGDGGVYIACNSCHSTNLVNVHDNNCAACHSGDPSPYESIGGSWAGGCQQAGCHTTYHADTTVSHWSVDDQCNKCHIPSWDVPDTSCAKCHAGYSSSDSIRPQTTSDVQSSYVGPARIEFSMTDNGKVGIGTFYSQLDGGTIETGSTILVATAGNHTLDFWGVDQAGNEELPHNTATFEITADTIPPVTTSNAVSSYSHGGTITLTATDASTLGVKNTYYSLNGAAAQVGRVVTLPQTTGTIAYTLAFWSEDWSGNIEAQNSISFTVTSGTGTIRLIWANSEEDPFTNPNCDDWAGWTIRSGSWSGPVVATGSGWDCAWDGVDDINVPIDSLYFVAIDWYYEAMDELGQSTFSDIEFTTSGQIVRIHY